MGGVRMKVEGVTVIRPASIVGGPETHRDNKTKQTKIKEVNIGKVVKGVEQDAKERSYFEEEEIITAIEKANSTLKGVDKRFEFSIHEGTREIMVKVIDDATDEIIREIPPEKILDMVAKIWELAGILVDRKI
jgi:flagellar protein FlaG